MAKAKIPKTEVLLSEEIRQLVRNGVNRADIVRLLKDSNPELDVTYGFVYHVTRDLVGIKRDFTQTRCFIGDRPRREVVMELYDSGFGPKAISEQLGVEYRYVANDIYDAKQRRLIDEAIS